ncbi:hypothetical protein ACRE_043580 [Hapsidospora chrysogenum ATCC 11550]|uniref:Uncharacterized protein n=1 Tax=Hapsidospora chrysogenum (strain ATCC 11550 / CBS 779.69 / DSM 880 / IAM 14645 / JCM 23072 / IMI 49137) TaxID=857340 RepID=A0A086T674_HAPC1|nr:hypothetical protein ACRE_043580 [Hapsidospora chrysogenum ATCC 11550]
MSTSRLDDVHGVTETISSQSSRLQEIRGGSQASRVDSQVGVTASPEQRPDPSAAIMAAQREGLPLLAHRGS